MNKLAICALTVLFVSTSAFAAPAKKPARPAPRAETREKAELNIPAPEVIQEGDTIGGLRFGTGSLYDGAFLFGGSVEHMFTPNFGAVALLQYGSYSATFGAGSVTGEWKYTIWSLGALASFHAGWVPLKNFDPYVTLGFAKLFISSKWKTSTSSAEPVGVETGGFHLCAYANARYWITENFGVEGGLGFGLGILNIGANYRF